LDNATVYRIHFDNDGIGAPSYPIPLQLQGQVMLIKPHHFVDIMRTLGDAQGEFKPHPYGHDVHAVAAKILADHGVMLQMELGADDICKPCVHNVDGTCDDTIDTSFRPQAPRSKQAWNLLIDQRWCTALGLAGGDRLTARQFCELLLQSLARMGDIYREIPPERVTTRAEELRRGIEKYLGHGGRV